MQTHSSRIINDDYRREDFFKRAPIIIRKGTKALVVVDEGEVHFVAGCHATEVDGGIAHTAEGGVDAAVGDVCNLLEGFLLVDTQAHDFLLGGRQQSDHLLDVLCCLLVVVGILDIAFHQFASVEEAFVILIGGRIHDGFAMAMAIHDEVVGNAYEPRLEAPSLGVAMTADADDSFEEGLLEDIFSSGDIADQRQDEAVDGFLIPFEEDVKRPVITILIEIDEYFVSLST